ncbi:MAG: hypothetical protein KAS32_07410 [Candidatus Peribacteraceae bacterium]|nr:hypothetical protein [Candidatus Peribacteraceae bacterium]
MMPTAYSPEINDKGCFQLTTIIKIPEGDSCHGCRAYQLIDFDSYCTLVGVQRLDNDDPVKTEECKSLTKNPTATYRR